MIWYFYAYTKTVWLALRVFGGLKLPISHQLRFTRKAANLSINFAGFSNTHFAGLSGKCAHLGIMSSFYDLVSDQSSYDKRLWDKMRSFYPKLLSQQSSKLLEDLLTLKQNNEIGSAGLDRGVHAVKIILSEFGQYGERVENGGWPESDIELVGVLCQVADDIIDYRYDINSNHLNYLKEDGAIARTVDFANWNSNAFFADKPKSFILKYAFTRAQKIAREKIIAPSQTKSNQSDRSNQLEQNPQN
jgi:hypothetical protein